MRQLYADASPAQIGEAGDSARGKRDEMDRLGPEARHRPQLAIRQNAIFGQAAVERLGHIALDQREVEQTMDDLRDAGVDILTLGQYLRPTPNHLAVERYVTPDEFDLYRREGLDKGFLEVVAGPMVRSSYRAEQVLQKNNVGLAV